MANFFIIHGTGNNPQGNWFPWLKSELEKLGHQVTVPQFPTPEGQNLQNWLDTFTPYIKQFDKDTILIGHSVGVPFLLNVLQKNDKSVKAAFLISGFFNPLHEVHLQPLTDSFIKDSFNWQMIKAHCPKFILFHSDNDPHISLDEAKELAQKLDGELNIIPGGGHLNIKSGFSEFPQLLEKIKELP